MGMFVVSTGDVSCGNTCCPLWCFVVCVCRVYLLGICGVNYPWGFISGNVCVCIVLFFVVVGLRGVTSLVFPFAVWLCNHGRSFVVLFVGLVCREYSLGIWIRVRVHAFLSYGIGCYYDVPDRELGISVFFFVVC